MSAKTSGGLVAPPVVFLHGFGSSYQDGWVRTGWTGWLNDLGRRAIGVDMLGHGTAPRPHNPADYADLGARVHAARGDEPLVDVVGFSAGAQVALRYALDHPASVRRLVLLSLGDSVFDPVRNGGRFAGPLRGEKPATPREAALLRKLLADPGADREALYAFTMRVRPPVLPAEAAGLTCPVLIVNGSEDFIAPPVRLSRTLPDATYVSVPDLDHFGTPRDNRVRTIVLDFLTAKESR